ncbi:hypothetical protein CGRA01v4_04643 [Colletotrichum graminicola]|uniref:Uncharacterized protein n=1 Tax=Colletotrichum graminicola (strain M1.001 / M2 / FGSC 10212) TaxID=645133 RepID=E3Q924_COLGM|nr:uncharacterized protein GLRG_02033 [Colletotrichum graminicola M1.001]EFQ27538.1 hypothetical protein GLRG_02033 [Colletotrichum graminicola M1.001]WDK13362.1 hypothetical protein CGRA01v4_04643 [Colletotrichum graminicola]
MLVKTFLLMNLGAFASAQTFLGFPESLTCKTDNGPATISETECQNAIVGPKGLKQDDSAANVASGHCSTLSGIPLFVESVAGKGDVGFAFDKSKNTYYFCFGQGVIDESGYPSSCTEN